MSQLTESIANNKASASLIGSGRFGTLLAKFEDGSKAVVKLKKFTDDPFRGVHENEFHKREVAAYRLDRDILGFGIVPETLLIKWGGHAASLQQYIEGFLPKELVPDIFNKKLPDWKERIAKLAVELPIEEVKKLIIFDLVTNNADRHGKNVLIDTANKRIWAIDNSVSFGPYFEKHKDIFHKYLFYINELVIPDEITRTLEAITEKTLKDTLFDLLPEEAITHTYWRVQFILDHRDRLAYKRISGGQGLDGNTFPTYQKWFDKKMQPKDDPSLVVFG